MMFQQAREPPRSPFVAKPDVMPDRLAHSTQPMWMGCAFFTRSFLFMTSRREAGYTAQVPPKSGTPPRRDVSP